MSTPFDIYRLGRVEYDDGLALQNQFQKARMAAQAPDTLLLLEHPPVITLGRGAKAFNILFPRDVLAEKGVEIFETDRGGDVTYHGPGQIVGYPLLHLGPGRQDVRKYVRNLEETLIRTLAHFGLAAHREEKWPGVWLKQSKAGGLRKIAQIGVHLSRWYTRHGFALNVQPDLSHFELIVPCGIREAGVTSISVELERPVSNAEVETVLIEKFAEVFEQSPTLKSIEQRTIAVAVRSAQKVLMLKRTAARGGFWQTITGKVEQGESPEAAAQRELKEETGLELKIDALGYRHSFALGETVPPRLVEETAFSARAPEGAQVRLEPEEHSELAWVEPAEAIAQLPFAGLRRTVQLAFR